MKIEAEQAKLGTDATAAQKQAVAGLVTQIDAAKTAQTALQGRSRTPPTRPGASAPTQLARHRKPDLDGARLSDVGRDRCCELRPPGPARR